MIEACHNITSVETVLRQLPAAPVRASSLLPRQPLLHALECFARECHPAMRIVHTVVESARPCSPQWGDRSRSRPFRRGRCAGETNVDLSGLASGTVWVGMAVYSHGTYQQAPEPAFGFASISWRRPRPVRLLRTTVDTRREAAGNRITTFQPEKFESSPVHRTGYFSIPDGCAIL